MVETALAGLPEYFEPISRLGEGGMGVVWSVRDQRVNKIGALKVIRRKADMTDVTITRFEREIRNFAQLIHPYIVQVYDVGQMLTGEPYIFMEQVNGHPICTALLKDRPFDEIMMLLDRILEGLDEAHAHGLIHRDLKPDNILVTVDEADHLIPKIMDFGLALQMDENDMRITCDGMVVGTPIYMAPEQACDEHYQICPATDFYSIGCILYELFSGDPPFKGANAVAVMVAQAKDKPKAFTPLPGFEEARRLTPIIDKLLEKMPDSRYETAADFRAALRRHRLICDHQEFGVQAYRNESDTLLDARIDINIPFFSSELAPKSYSAILPELEHCNYNHSVLSLRPPLYVGNQSAKMILNRYLRDVYRCRRAAVALITGRPGVGKSRFLESFCQDCFHQGTATSLVVDGANGANLRFAVYRALFAKLLLKALTPQQVMLALCRFLHCEDDRDPRVMALSAIFQAEINGLAPPLEKMDDLIGTVFAMLTRVRPLVLCFDNVRSEQRLELCAIARDLTDKPSSNKPVLICVVNTAMNEVPTDMEIALGNENSIWLRRGITIEPLSSAGMHSLITQSLGISEELSGFIENMAQGIPQIAVDLARQWQLAGFLEPTSRGYVSRQPIESLPIPKVVHESILRQLNMTFAGIQQRLWHPVAAIAALLGPMFTPKLLSAAIKCLTTNPQNPTSQRLISHSSFISLGLSGGVLKTLDETTLAFSNPLMREALIAVLRQTETKAYHLAIVTAREALPPSFDNKFEIAEHQMAATNYKDAFEGYLHLARQCVLWGNLDQAKAFVESAKAAIKMDNDVVDSRTPGMADIWFIEADICLEENDVTGASKFLAWLEYASESFQNDEQYANYYVLKSRYCSRQNETEDARRFIDMAFEYVQKFGDAQDETKLEIKFSVLIVCLEFDMPVSQLFIDTARSLNDILYVGRAFLAIARRSISAGDMVRATKILNMAIDTAHKNGDARTESCALHLLSQVQYNAPEVRLKTLYDASRGFEAIGDFKELGVIHSEIAELLKTTSPVESRIHAQWSALLDGLV